MENSANFSIIEVTQRSVVLRDLGPWDIFPTITNDAPNVVRRVRHVLRGRRLFYWDSMGELTELCLTDNCKFREFRHAEQVL